MKYSHKNLLQVPLLYYILVEPRRRTNVQRNTQPQGETKSSQRGTEIIRIAKPKQNLPSKRWIVQWKMHWKFRSTSASGQTTSWTSQPSIEFSNVRFPNQSNKAYFDWILTYGFFVIRKAFNLLDQQIHQLAEDIKTKTCSVVIDSRCMEIRNEVAEVSCYS